MDLISTGARRGGRMLDRLLKFASVDARAVDLTEVDLAELLAEVLAGLSATILDRQAAISAADLPVVRADRILLAQVLQNLIANALKFTTDRPPAISISAARDGDGWRIAVADDGPGIGEAERRHIFEMFRRAGGSDEAGLGMGLAMCAKIVQRHGGRIWCDSTPGTGSTFSFILPAGAD
jgi:signal transduction histidine kinase